MIGNLGSAVRKALLRIGIVLLCCSAVAQAQSSGDVLDRMLLNSIVLISYEVVARPAPGAPAGSVKSGQVLGVKSGTGFLLFRNVGITKGSIYLVTNRHVLPPEGAPQDVRIRVVAQGNEGPPRIDEIKIPIVGADGKYLPSVRVSPDPATDVAAVSIGPEALGSKFQVLTEAVKTGRYLSASLLVPPSQLKSMGIGLGSQVYILGYPAAIFDPRNVAPVLRVGVISTDPVAGYNFNDELRRTMGFPEHIDGFLIDANVYPGSSGSLVISAPRGCGCEPAKGAPTGPVILGIISGSIPIFDASLRSYERIGLGMVYSAQAIKQVIDSFSH